MLNPYRAENTLKTNKLVSCGERSSLLYSKPRTSGPYLCQINGAHTVESHSFKIQIPSPVFRPP